MKTIYFLLTILVLGACTTAEQTDLSLVINDEDRQETSYSLEKLIESLNSNQIAYEEVSKVADSQSPNVLIIEKGSNQGSLSGNTASPINEAESFRIAKKEASEKNTWVVSGSDRRGLMYALFSVAESINGNNAQNPLVDLEEINESPDVKTRAISMYTMNRAYWESRFYDETYWTKYMDMLTRNRFNSVVVIFGYENGGFLAPCYPYFFDVDGFPEVKMNNLSDADQAKNLKAINRMIELAHERGLEFKVGIWDHIYRGGVQTGGISDEDLERQSQDYLTQGLTTENLYAFTKTALKQLLQEMPELDGIQFRMHNESGLKPGKEMEEFWTEIFTTLKAVAPDFRIDLRAKELPDEIIQIASDLDLNFTITTKYWMEQMGLPFHPTHINRQNQSDRRHGYADMLKYPKTYNMHWRMWSGGTQRVLLWGNPEYVRRFAESTHLYDGDGFEVNEPLATKMLAQPHDAEPFQLLNEPYRYYQYEFERYWHFFQLFGRVTYDPDMDESYWTDEFEKRFGKEAGPHIMQALHKSSFILPMINAACAPYSLFPTTRGWAAKQILGKLDHYATGEGSDIQQFASYAEEAQVLLNQLQTGKRLPSQTSRWFLKTAHEIDKLIEESEKFVSLEENKEYLSTITDLKILANLARYHAYRMPAAVNYQIFLKTKNTSALDYAMEFESKAISAWEDIVEAVGDIYAPDVMMGVRNTVKYGIVHSISGHWKDELMELKKFYKELQAFRNTLPAPEAKGDTPKCEIAEDIDYSSLFNITHNPVESIGVGEDLVVKVEAEAAAGIKWIRLRHRAVNQTLDYESVEMTKTGEGPYSVTIPREQIDLTYDFMYFIEIMDQDGNGRIYPDFEKETPYYFVSVER